MSDAKPSHQNGDAMHRIDDSHHQSATAGHLSDQCGSWSPVFQESLFKEHSQELVELLQNWSDRLDRREAELNARLAMLEHHERKFRLGEQTHAVELSEQDRSLERRRKELEAEIRRLAVGNLARSSSRTAG